MWSLNKEILRLALPNIVSNISVPLISTVDTALMGQLSTTHLGAVGLGSMIFNFLYWNFGFLRMGTTGLVAQAYGADDAKMASDVLWRSVMIALVIALVIFLFQGVLYDLLATLLDVQAEHTELVRQYFDYRILAAPATLLLYVLLGWFFGNQNAWMPLVITIVINVLNIIVSYWLVSVESMGIAGVAIGTVISQSMGLLLAIGLIVYKYRAVIHAFSQDMMREVKPWLAFFDVNADLFLRTICLTGAFAIFYRESAQSGTIILAANVVLLQFINWLSYGIDGYAYAAESIVGKYAGERQYGKMNDVIALINRWGLAIAVGFTVFIWLFQTGLVSIFTDDQEVMDYIDGIYYLILLTPIVAYACYLWDGIYIGVLETRIMRNTMFLALIVYGLCLWCFFSDWELRVWYSFLIFLGARGLLLWWCWRYKVLSRFEK